MLSGPTAGLMMNARPACTGRSISFRTSKKQRSQPSTRTCCMVVCEIHVAGNATTKRFCQLAAFTQRELQIGTIRQKAKNRVA